MANEQERARIFPAAFFKAQSKKPYPAVSYMARVHVVDFSAENSAMTIHLKELACEPKSYSQTEVDSASSVGIDIYTLIKDRPVVMCSNANEFVDNVYNLKAYVNQIQLDTFNLQKSTATKIPQTEKASIFWLIASIRWQRDLSEPVYLLPENGHHPIPSVM